jgi:hypothetical protein
VPRDCRVKSAQLCEISQPPVLDMSNGSDALRQLVAKWRGQLTLRVAASRGARSADPTRSRWR